MFSANMKLFINHKHTHVCVYVCVYIYICIYMYIYTHTHGIYVFHLLETAFYLYTNLRQRP